MKKVIAFLIIVAGLYGAYKPLPAGISIAGSIYAISPQDVSFYQDVTYVDEEGVRYSEQEIFDTVFDMIDEAHHYILIDMFLFNNFLGTATSSYRQLSSELSDTLIEKKKKEKDVKIVLITDPINEIYGGYQSTQLSALTYAGVDVVVTDLTELRDSNPLYSAFWRSIFQWFGNSPKEGMLPNPFDAHKEKLSMRTYLSLFNFKANHRKVIVADKERGGQLRLSTLITSANPHDGSSAHTNTAIVADSFVWKDVIASEQAIADFSGAGNIGPDKELVDRVVDREGDMEIQVVTEEKIREKILGELQKLEEGDSFDMAMFYLSDRKIVKALKDAAQRGVKMRILLDPNKDAFGREKNGVPNRVIAKELLDSSGNVEVRWCYTHGEQCHTKLLLFASKDAQVLIQGSANLTRRNIGDYNLETDLFIKSSNGDGVIGDAKEYFEKVWNNTGGKLYSVEYDFYKDESFMKLVMYQIMERTGLSSF